jgi:hypothetical protein
VEKKPRKKKTAADEAAPAAQSDIKNNSQKRFARIGFFYFTAE